MSAQPKVGDRVKLSHKGNVITGILVQETYTEGTNYATIVTEDAIYQLLVEKIPHAGIPTAQKADQDNEDRKTGCPIHHTPSPA